MSIYPDMYPHIHTPSGLKSVWCPYTQTCRCRGRCRPTHTYSLRAKVSLMSITTVSTAAMATGSGYLWLPPWLEEWLGPWFTKSSSSGTCPTQRPWRPQMSWWSLTWKIPPRKPLNRQSLKERTYSRFRPTGPRLALESCLTILPHLDEPRIPWYHPGEFGNFYRSVHGRIVYTLGKNLWKRIAFALSRY